MRPQAIPPRAAAPSPASAAVNSAPERSSRKPPASMTPLLRRWGPLSALPPYDAFMCRSSRRRKECVIVAVRRRAAAQEAQRRGGDDLVPRAGGNEGCVARSDAASFAVDLELALAFEHEVDLLAGGVVVPLRRLTGPEGRLGEALRRRVVELPDLRAVLRGERGQIVA